jgi:hypothetical protein
MPTVDTATPPSLTRSQPTDRLIDHDAVTVARREALDLDHPDPKVRRLAVATLRQALHEMELTDPAIGDYCPRLTHEQGGLSERYTGATVSEEPIKHGPTELFARSVLAYFSTRAETADVERERGAALWWVQYAEELSLTSARTPAPAGHARKGLGA